MYGGRVIIESIHEEQDLDEADFECSSVCRLNVGDSKRLFWIRVERTLIRWLCIFNRINIIDCLSRPQRPRPTKVKLILRYFKWHAEKVELDGSKGAKEARISVKRYYWPSLIQVFILIVLLKLIVGTYKSYQFDFCKFKYHQALKLNSTPSSTSRSNIDLSIDQLAAQVAEAREKLIGIGVLYQDSNFVVQIWNVFVIALTSFLHFVSHIAFSGLINIHFVLGNILLNFSSLKRSYLRLALWESRKVINSADNFHQSTIPTADMSLFYSTYNDDDDDDYHNNNNNNNNVSIKSMATRRASLARRLKGMLSAGRLAPLTWQHDWVALCNAICLGFTLFTATFGLSFIFFMYIFLPSLTSEGGGVGRQQSNWWLWWWQLAKTSDELLLSVFALTSGALYIPIVVVMTIDHISHVRKLIDLIKTCRTDNYGQYLEVLQSIGDCGKHSRDQLEQWREQVNTNLLSVLMHYKISVCLSRSVERTSVIYVATSSTIFFLLPILTVMHGPYLNDKGAMVKYSYALMCAGNIIMFNSIIGPMCYLHSRAFDIYKQMSGLLADSVECQARLEALQEAALYDQHLVSLLRKELNHPQTVARQFTIVVLGSHTTYSNLLRIHFWFGLIILAMLGGVSSRKEMLLGGFFGDPFGLL